MNNKKVLFFIYSICKPYKKWYILLCIAPILNGFILASINYDIKIIIDTINKDVFCWQIFITPFGILVLAELCSRTFWSLHDYSEYKLHGTANKEVYIKIYEYLQNHSYSYFQNNFSGSLISKSKSIMKGFYNFWDNISHRLLQDFSVLIVNFFMIIFLSKELILPFGMCIFIILFTTFLQSKKYEKYSFEIERYAHKFIGMYSDKITNIVTILNFAKKDKEIDEIRSFQNKELLPRINKMDYFNFISWLFLGILYTTMILCLFFYVIYLRKINTISTGTLATLILIIYSTIRQVFLFVNSLFSFISSFADFRASLDGIFVEQNIIDKSDAKVLVI